MVVFKNRLFLNGIFDALLDLVGRLFRFEIYQTAGVLPVFKDMYDGIGRPFTLIAGVVAAGVSASLVWGFAAR